MSNVCFIKIRSKRNSNTLLSLLLIFMKQTLLASNKFFLQTIILTSNKYIFMRNKFQTTAFISKETYYFFV